MFHFFPLIGNFHLNIFHFQTGLCNVNSLSMTLCDLLHDKQVCFSFVRTEFLKSLLKCRKVMNEIEENAFKVIVMLATKFSLTFLNLIISVTKCVLKYNIHNTCIPNVKCLILVIYYSDFPCNNLGQS